MNLSDFKKLKKMMASTTSESDGEALNAIRAANRLLADWKLDWEKVFSRTVTVIDEVEEAPPAARKTASWSPSDRKSDEALLDDVDRVADDKGGSALDFAASCREYFEKRGHLTPAQRAALREIRDR